MNSIIRETEHKHASENTVYHCLYSYYYLAKSKADLAKIFNKNEKTISRWVSRYEADGTFSRITKENNEELQKFTEKHRDWIANYYKQYPLKTLDEAKQEFEANFQVEISKSTLCRILADKGFTYKKIERRAIQIRTANIIDYFNEMSSFYWCLSCLTFLDEISFDNLSLLRDHGYAPKGEKLIYRGQFVRKPRLSCLAFLQQDGLSECYESEGTFNRLKFFDCCRNYAKSGKVQTFPGKGSVWVMDGARIHTDKNIIHYLRSIGIIPVFLPPYSPFFNPLELVFGYVKKFLQNTFETSGLTLEVAVAGAMDRFKNFDATKIYRKCGYIANGVFDPSVAFNLQFAEKE